MSEDIENLFMSYKENQDQAELENELASLRKSTSKIESQDSQGSKLERADTGEDLVRKFSDIISQSQNKVAMRKATNEQIIKQYEDNYILHLAKINTDKPADMAQVCL
jgi:lipid II:glycine glycyltransferase (peptidoglycan interpeptide bridge formation enzyme)